MPKKRLSILGLLTALLLVGCSGGSTGNVVYRVYTAQNRAYSVEVPADFSLRENHVSGYMAFYRPGVRPSDMAFLTIHPTDMGFDVFDENLRLNPGRSYVVYARTPNSKFAECSKGEGSAVKLGMIREVDGQTYLIILSGSLSRGDAESMIRHICDSMAPGVDPKGGGSNADSDVSLWSPR